MEHLQGHIIGKQEWRVVIKIVHGASRCQKPIYALHYGTDGDNIRLALELIRRLNSALSALLEKILGLSILYICRILQTP